MRVKCFAQEHNALLRPAGLEPGPHDPVSRGPFLESPGNFSGPKPEFGIKARRVARVPAHKGVHFVPLTVTLKKGPISLKGKRI